MGLLGTLGPSGAANIALDPRLLVRLARDILVVRSHEEIRSVDGPGDGGRDIHSRTPAGEKHLAQSKFHGDATVACSSTELAELPMAMVKMGYSHGLFVTNARISPQGKREYLDNYPQLKLEFMDGEALAAEILSYPPLRALWFDGASITAVNTCVAVPCVVRRHDDDQPYEIPSSEWQHAECYLRARFPDRTFRLRVERAGLHRFPKYRAPEPLTFGVAVSQLQVIEVVVGNVPSLADIGLLAAAVSRAIGACLDTTVHGYTIRTGTVHLTPLSGAEAGANVTLEGASASLVLTKFASGSEADWFSVVDSEHWTDRTDARQSEAELIRLYNPELDCALGCDIYCRASVEASWLNRARRETTEHGWVRSVFCLVRRWEGAWPYPDIPEPDEQGPWPWSNTTLCGWHHWSLLGSLIPSTWPAQAHGEEREKERLDRIRAAVRLQPTFEVIPPDKARHMVAIIGRDPYLNAEFVSYCTGELAVMPDTVPTPIRPQARQFELTMAWETELHLGKLKTQLEQITRQERFSALRQLTVTQWKKTLVVSGPCANEAFNDWPIYVILDWMHGLLEEFVAALNADEQLRGHLKLATKEFWQREYNVALGTSAYESRKPYVWLTQENGEILPCNTMAFLAGGGMQVDPAARDQPIDPAILECLRARKGPGSSPVVEAFCALDVRLRRIRDDFRNPNLAADREFTLRALVACMSLGDLLARFAREAEPRQSPVDAEAESTSAGVSRSSPTTAVANAFNPELDKLAASIVRLADAQDVVTLKQAVTTVIGVVRQLYESALGVQQDIVDETAWGDAAESEIDKSTRFYEAYAYAGFHTMRGVVLAAMLRSPQPPKNAREAFTRANRVALDQTNQVAEEVRRTSAPHGQLSDRC